MQSTKFCTNCGKPLAPGVRFCNNCGAPVKMSAPPSSSPSPPSTRAQGNKFRVRVRSRSYDRLAGSWRDVQVSSLEDWKRQKDSLLQEFRQRYSSTKVSRSRFGMAPGTEYQRWNDATWSKVSGDLTIDGEQDVLAAVRS